MTGWELFTSLSGSIVLTGGVVVFIAKQFIKYTSDSAIQKQQFELDLLSSRDQIAYSSLHSERAQIVKSIFQELTQIEDDLSTYRYGITNGAEQDALEAVANECWSSILDLERKIKMNEIYFTSNDLGSLQNVSTVLFQLFHASAHAMNLTFLDHEKLNDFQRSTFSEKLKHKLDEIDQITSQTIPEERLKLANRFRRLIGVESIEY